ncbi:MAG TPA: sigma-70 family RNA polymerase sigma factor [Verrucomicrobiae bacterium]|nr:sigma-70 family RNA polymerase sigma factor [Verrucomicrobiae bacterium]
MRSETADWQTFFDEVAPRLLLYARQWTSSHADAEDVVQMAFVRFWRRFPGGDRKNLPLLYASVRSIALDLRRSDQRRTARESFAETVPGREDTPFFKSEIEDSETAHIVQAALNGLPEEQREVLTLRLWAGLTFAEVAKITGQSINTVASRYRYAVETLARRLAPFHDDLAAIPAKTPTDRTLK